ncbi:hypothetical protein GGH13_009513, partial [Coemansia sp. S155-1]
MSDFDDSDAGSDFALGDSPVKPKAKPKATAVKAKAKPAGQAANGDGPSSKREGPSVEEIYQKKTPIEHILL